MMLLSDQPLIYKEIDPLEVVFCHVGPMEGWPNVNRTFVTEAFHYENEKYSKTNT